MTRTFHLLPFDWLSPADFERLCLWLVRREGYEKVEHVGLSGMDRGCDLVAWSTGRRIGFQCKRSHRFGPGEAATAVVKALSSSHLDEIILIVACRVSAEARDRARSKAGAIPCQIWGHSELDERVNRYPDLITHFFGPERLPITCVPSDSNKVDVVTIGPLLLACCGLYLTVLQKWSQKNFSRLDFYLVRRPVLGT